MTQPNLDNEKQLETVDLNIVIFPDELLSSTIIQWSNMVTDHYPTIYTLNTTDHLPHFSLYSAQYPKKNLVRIYETVRSISKSTQAFPITFSKISSFSGYLFYDAIKSDALMNLHTALVTQLNPLREGCISETQKQLVGLSSAQQQAIQDYGYVSVGDLYMPHVSITKLKQSEDIQNAIALIPHQTNSFHATEVAIAPFGPYGTCPQPLLQLPFTT